MDLVAQIEQVRASHPEVVAELERLADWVAVCIGSDIAALGGKAVD